MILRIVPVFLLAIQYLELLLVRWGLKAHKILNNLSSTVRYFFRKSDRLSSRKTIEELFSKGNSFSHFPFKVIWLQQNNKPVLQLAVGVSTRNFKKATDRNRIKRLIREAYRLQKGSLHDQLQAKERQLSVFILYVGKDIPAYSLVSEKIAVLLKRLAKLTDETNQTVS